VFIGSHKLHQYFIRYAGPVTHTDTHYKLQDTTMSKPNSLS